MMAIMFRVPFVDTIEDERECVRRVVINGQRATERSFRLKTARENLLHAKSNHHALQHVLENPNGGFKIVQNSKGQF
jgi:ribosomal protein S4